MTLSLGDLLRSLRRGFLGAALPLLLVAPFLSGSGLAALAGALVVLGCGLALSSWVARAARQAPRSSARVVLLGVATSALAGAALAAVPFQFVYTEAVVRRRSYAAAIEAVRLAVAHLEPGPVLAAGAVGLGAAAAWGLRALSRRHAVLLWRLEGALLAWVAVSSALGVGFLIVPSLPDLVGRGVSMAIFGVAAGSFLVTVGLLGGVVWVDAQRLAERLLLRRVRSLRRWRRARKQGRGKPRQG